MTMLEPKVLGKAIFGTVRGLRYQGAGILTEAPTGVFDFEVARRGDSVFHQLERDTTVTFCRRLVSGTRRTFNMVGAIAPCRDLNDRPGFVGSCVAIEADGSRQNQAFSDWAVLQEVIYSLLKPALEMIDASTQTLQWRQLLPEPSPQRSADLQAVPGENLSLEPGGAMSEAEILRVLQAVAYCHGHDCPTMILFPPGVTRAVPLDGPDAEKAVHAFSEAQAVALEAAHRPKTAASDGATHHSASLHKVDGSLEDAWAHIEVLTDEVVTLREDLNQLRRMVQPESRQRSNGGHHIPRFALEDNEPSEFSWWWVGLVGAATALVIVLALVAYLWLRSGDDEEVSELEVPAQTHGSDVLPGSGTDTEGGPPPQE